MAVIKYTYPRQTATGSGTFSDDLVGFQLVDGGGLTQGNFAFTESVTEKVNRDFYIGAFSDPITLETLDIDTIEESRRIIAKNFRVYPNYDLTNVTNFTVYGSLSKRLETSVTKIINYFPAAIEVSNLTSTYSTASTATLISYDQTLDETYFEIDASIIRNPFEIDFSVNSARNLSLREIPVSGLRDMTNQFKKYSLFVNGGEYNVILYYPTSGLTSGQMRFYVQGNPFSGQSVSYDYLIIRPQTYYTEESFVQDFDEVEKFLLNRLVNPPYTASFQSPESTDDGTFYLAYRQVTWPLDGQWNLDIRTIGFDNYLNQLSDIGDGIDQYKTNIISRFLTTDSIKEFDTPDQKMEKVLQLYGRSFDQVKHFIDALAYMNSVNYNIHNDIPSQLLKNLSETLGWKTNISPITNEDFLSSVFGNTTEIIYSGLSRAQTPDEVNFQYYRNLILNSAYLFKSKGTRKSIEGLMRLIGAPEALVEFNETIYLAGQRINMSQFNTNFAKISGGTYIDYVPTLDPNITYSIKGVTYTGYNYTPIIKSVTTLREDYPVDDLGFPMMAQASANYFFQKGAGWYESTPQHRSPEEINYTTSTFTGQNYNIQTQLEPFTYGQKYLERYRNFPFLGKGYTIRQIIDNKKSWAYNEDLLRTSFEGNFNAIYQAESDKFVLNVKNVDLFLNPAQGLSYDVWVMCNQYNYPIPQTGLTSPYPSSGGVDWTQINPQPQTSTFFEFAQKFWINMINVRDRLYSFDGKTSGYPLLQKIYWLYLDSGQAINVPNDNFTYTTMIKYVEGIGGYWMKLVDQMVPATTIWNGGVKYENSIFHRQKFVWRRQAGCQIIPIPCTPCELTSNLFPEDCMSEYASCSYYPTVNNIPTELYYVLGQVLLNSGIDPSNTTCDLNSLITKWYIEVKINGVQMIYQKFFDGLGYGVPGVSSPTSIVWDSAVDTAFTELFNYGFWYSQNGFTITVFNLGCDANDVGNLLEINVGVDYSIQCLS